MIKIKNSSTLSYKAIGNVIDKYRSESGFTMYDEIEIVGVKEETRKRLEFIKYLESEIGCRELISDSLFNHNKELKIYKEVLQKYKEIIGDDK